MSGLSESVQGRILDWYDAEARELPWRNNPYPWPVLVSEFVLQQTQMAVGLTHWHRMMERFPTIESMASCPVEDVLEAWQGCGYYARARNLHALAVEIASRNPPCLPSNPQDLQDLPEGPYTAAAVSSIAFDYPIAVVDGNIRRIYARTLAEEYQKTVISRHGLTNFVSAVLEIESGLNGTRCNNLHLGLLLVRDAPQSRYVLHYKPMNLQFPAPRKRKSKKIRGMLS